MTSKRKPFRTQLRRSISEQLRDSTARAWDLLWKNVRERRLAGRCPRDSGAAGQEEAPAAWSVRPTARRRFGFSFQSQGLSRADRAHPSRAGPARPERPRCPVGVGSAPRAR